MTRSPKKRRNIKDEENSSTKKRKHDSKTVNTKVQQETKPSPTSPQLTDDHSITTKKRRRRSKKANQMNEKNKIQILKELCVDSSGRVRYESVIVNNKAYISLLHSL
jgi:hypothetical protein